jgi:hypothetical protein
MCVPGVPAPPGVVILAPPEVLRNAEGRKVKAAPKRMWPPGAAKGIIEAGARKPWPGRLGVYSSSMKVISTLTL